MANFKGKKPGQKPIIKPGQKQLNTTEAKFHQNGKKNILMITPTTKSAIYTLAELIKNNNNDFNYQIATFHPKKPNQKEIEIIKSSWKNADLIDMQYWKSGSKIKELFPDMWKSKNKLLTHYNPYNLHEESWEDYKKIVVVNKTQLKELPQAILIPLCIDLGFFKFGNYTKEKTVNMSVSRIEGKKGVLEVAQVCKELGYKFILVGRVSDAQYMTRVKDVCGKYLEFHQDVSNNELRDCYYKSAIHVCNSVDSYESGTLPVLEAMACGVPVVTRNVGHVPDINTGKNLKLHIGQPNDLVGLKKAIKDLMDDESGRIEMRKLAYESIKDRTQQRFAQEYLNLYKKLT